jgi:hypothetical protein
MVRGFLLISILVIIFVVVLKDHTYKDLPQSIADLKSKILAIKLWTLYFLGGRDGGVDVGVGGVEGGDGGGGGGGDGGGGDGD